MGAMRRGGTCLALALAALAHGALVLPSAPRPAPRTIRQAPTSAARLPALPLARPPPRRAAAPARMLLRASTLRALWPTTLSKFWGAHALGWAAATSAAALLRPAPPLAFPPAGAAAGAAHLALAFLLYRHDDDAGAPLALLGGAYFAGAAALLAATLPPRGAARLLRLWHAALAVGALLFAVKASLKDRLFTQEPPAGRAAARGGMPTLALINSKSGAKLGERIAVRLQELAKRPGEATLQVADLSETSPREAIAAFAAAHPVFRLLACGGDGTVTWILSDLEDLALPYQPPLAVLPLGTGNDLARVLGWGKGIRLDGIESMLRSLDSAHVAFVDRWMVTGVLPEGKTSLRMANYLSIGCDAKAALLWARMARAVPFLFRLRLLNKLWYIVCGTPEFFLHSYADLSERCRIVCDGKPITIPKSLEGLMIASTPSYGGGSDLWDERRSAPLRTRLRHVQTECSPASMGDGKLEVVGVTGVLHLANALGGISNGVRLCQGSNISVSVVGGGVPLQIDGEPFNIDPVEGIGSEPFEVTIEQTGQALMLASADASGARERPSAAVAIDQALASGSIDVRQRDALLKALG
ncbi:hypothetical protein AB1Y20_015577 [Prymnesium parvum]|uniref:Diacylglycerol kinase n=1 Tax=Prymnesium parvum TaxID=97485 RepID=A0AB34K1C5_PRYPA